jgi:hypothetical protein
MYVNIQNPACSSTVLKPISRLFAASFPAIRDLLFNGIKGARFTVGCVDRIKLFSHVINSN